MKTAIEEAIDFIENKDYNYLDGKFLQFANEIKDKLTELLQKEREQIESAIYNVLYREMKENSGCVLEQEKDMFRDTAKDYYSTTFKK